MLAAVSRWTIPPLIVISALVACRLIVIGPRQPDVVLPQNEPLVIAPRYADERVVTDEQLDAVLARVKPPAAPVNTNNFVHALRLWGKDATFPVAVTARVPTPRNGTRSVPATLDGCDLLDYFLDDRAFRSLAGENTPPLFYRGRDGIEVRSFDDRLTDRETSSYHTDDLVATLAEVGMPLDEPLRLRDGDATVGELLETALRRFHPDQLECEWTAIAFARYVHPQRQWRNKYGQRIDVDALVTRLVSQPPELGPCNGLHRLEALAVLYRADEQSPSLRATTRRSMLAYMQHASRQLAAAQSPEGYWSRQWPLGAAAPPALRDQPPPLYDKLLVTGHHLEWLALAPQEVQPPRETVVRAAQWLARTLIEMDERDLAAAYGPYTHAARALCLWRGTEAWPAWQRLHASELAPPVASR